jgi:hypothetical protein
MEIKEIEGMEEIENQVADDFASVCTTSVITFDVSTPTKEAIPSINSLISGMSPLSASKHSRSQSRPLKYLDFSKFIDQQQVTS